ncbi:MAG: hypothetical protein KDD67_10605 [Ignavibacteriae bacterium]|nr:hypothetical protein [Ignavibacteriota bacterium]MCB9217791.1 hypothetical protein [Ignavibacteria bacterium]
MNRTTTLFLSVATVVLTFAISADVEAQSLTNPTKLYTGAVLSLGSEEAVNEAILYVYEDPYSTPVTSSRITTNTSEYRVLLDPATLYWFRVEALGHFTDDFMVASPRGTNYEELKFDLHIRPIPIDSTLYRGTPFEGETAAWGDQAGMKGVLAFMLENPTVKVEIGVGLEVNEVDPLTQDRVNAIKQLFREMEVSTTRIKWDRKVGDQFGTITMKISGFETP